MYNNQKSEIDIPSSSEVADFITRKSPEGSHCVDADFLKMRGFCLAAWVIEKALDEKQGYYQAFAVLCEKGNFGEIKKSIPARYYDEAGKRIITSSAFGIPSTEKGTPLITERGDEQVVVTLAPAGKPISQMLILRSNMQKKCKN